MKPKKHRHVFTALWYHFGPYSGRRDTSHIHSCFTKGCETLLIGAGFDCDGKGKTHHREVLK